MNLDKLTYAGNLENLRDVEDDPRYSFVHGDICDARLVDERAGRRRRHRQLRRRDARRPLHQRAAGLHPHRRARHPRAARGGARATGSRATCRSPPTRSTGRIADGLVHRDRPAVPHQPVLGQQGRRRPARARLPHAPTACRCSSRAAPTTTAPTSTRRRSSRCSSPTPSTASRCPCTATAATCATGSTSRTTAPRIDLVLRQGDEGEIYNVGGGNEIDEPRR